MVELSYSTLRKAIIGEIPSAVVRITSTYEPAGGPGSRVFPPTYPTTERSPSPYIKEKRRRGDEILDAVVLDQVPSQANRAEEALEDARSAGRVRLPALVIRHEGQSPVTLTSFDLPHRYADAYLRDSLIDGVKFDRTDLGKAFQAASLDDATPLFQHDPGSLIYGAWNSHRKGRQAKFPRIYASEIVGWDPQEAGRKAGRMDPLNLQGARAGDGDEWAFTPAAAKAKNAKLSEIGHGNIAPNDSHGGVTVSSATRFATLSLTGLSRIRFGSASSEAIAAARTLLAAIAMLGDRLAFGVPGLWLRSGCDLVLEAEQLAWVGRGASVEPFDLTPEGSVRLYEEGLAAAEAAGMPMDLEPVALTPGPALAKAIDYTLTKAEGTGE